MAKHNKANRKAKRSTSENYGSTPCAATGIEPSHSDRPTRPETRFAKVEEPQALRPSLASLWQQAEDPQLAVVDPISGKSIASEQMESKGAVLEHLTDRLLEDGFFAERVDSIAPFADDLELEPAPFLAPAHVLVRRGKMRRAVAWTLGVLAVASIALVANARMPRRSALIMPTDSAANHSAIVSSTPTQQADPSLEVSKALLPSKAERATEASVAPIASAITPVVSVANPLKESLNLLNRGKLEAAITMADLAIEQQPTDATAYLYRGAALQDLGRRKQAVEAYSDCVRNATKGPVQECRALGGKK